MMTRKKTKMMTKTKRRRRMGEYSTGSHDDSQYTRADLRLVLSLSLFFTATRQPLVRSARPDLKEAPLARRPRQTRTTVMPRKKRKRRRLLLPMTTECQMQRRLMMTVRRPMCQRTRAMMRSRKETSKAI